MKDTQREGRHKIIENHVSELMKFFDTVQIFCTKYEKESEGQTSYYANGDGNIFSRYGQCKLWIKKEEQISKNSEDED
ncbi:MAG: hypothetical protein A2W75_02685 [Nitrospinae bacterium RIFCSPLOWO2_12_39_15]|nr:MAG: hypothetical protein A2W75_02685 [Nitrospinae bacterium RIFCSPLOWO2_12_39_15]